MKFTLPPCAPAPPLTPQVGLLFTSRPQEEVTTYFQNLAVADHAPPGFVHTETIPLPLGSLGNWPVSMMEQFRKLGVVVEVEEGVLVNRKAINMCTAGEPISPEGAKLLVSAGGILLRFAVEGMPIGVLSFFRPLGK